MQRVFTKEQRRWRSTKADQPATLNELLGKMVTELGAAYVGASVILGDQLGLYKELAAGGALTPAQLAERTGTAERYVREWLAAQAASGYIDYDATAGTFSLSPEQAMVFAQADSPVIMTGGFYSLQAVYESRAAHGRGVSHRQGPRVGRALQLPVLRDGEVLRPWLSRQSGLEPGCPRWTAW